MLLAGRTGIRVKEKQRKGIGEGRGAHSAVFECCALVTEGCGEGKEEGRESRAGEGSRERQRETDADT